MIIIERSREINGPAIMHKELGYEGFIEVINGDEAEIVLDTGLNSGSPMRVKLTEIELIAQRWP